MISEASCAAAREMVVLTDTDEWYREQLRTRFGGEPNVAVDALTLPDDRAARVFSPHRLDTVVALNVPTWLGKPFLVHMPSRPVTWDALGRHGEYQGLDWRRVRWLW